MGQSIPAPQHEARDAHGRARIGARIEDDPRLESGQPAVLGHSRLELEEARRRRRRRQELLGAGEHQGHRTLERHRQCGGQRLEKHELAAEAAAQRRGHDAHLMLGQSERLGHLRARVEERLRRGPHRDTAEGVHRGDGHAGLEITLVDHARAVGALDHDVGLGKALDDVTASEVLRARDVGGKRFREGGASAGRPVLTQLRVIALTGALAHEGRLGTHGLERVDGRGQDLVLDLDESGGVLGHGLALRDHGDHRVADEAYPIEGERAAVAVRGILVGQGQIAPGEDTNHAGHRPSRARIHLEHARMRMVREHEPRMKHAGLNEIGGKAGETRGLLASVHAGQRLSDGRGRGHV